jgi:hypothetical protein
MTNVIEAIERMTSDADAEVLTPQEVATRRKYCDWLALWRHCDQPACRRTRACAGDPTACLAVFYLGCPEPARTWVRIGVVAMEDGSTARAATELADHAMILNLKRAARLPLPLRNWRRRQA